MFKCDKCNACFEREVLLQKHISLKRCNNNTKMEIKEIRYRINKLKSEIKNKKLDKKKKKQFPRSLMRGKFSLLMGLIKKGSIITLESLNKS